MREGAAAATAFLKTLAHDGRLMILCHLSSGEKSVSELEALLDLRQAAASQMLARLREGGLVEARRDGKAVFFSLSNDNTEEMIALLHKQFCDGG
ncbi:helix-turn-helix transcriptional regulator [Leisingera sp. ANG59]|uniref:ArsR/SmtB family transcription factor n=1 Tax=Leisingera sp. ANG59 TaxID=2675221 RepID=UPI001571C4E4|nr:metalloregulator ArsR/SmtB family transcription factor [Leisingera sp. ANG59]NSY38063.1 metalloregulator ArsR/SmtB family transcription factor [Leisingera sp. ANG59]